MYNILIIEDEEAVAEVIKAYLEREGFKVYHKTKAVEGIQLFNTNEIDLVILDLMLPDMPGESVCRILREKSDVHIFMLTAKGNVDDRIEGLNIGADEYLVKPFSPRELVARVNALFRRVKKDNISSGVIYDDGRLLVDCDKRLVKINNDEVQLTPSEFDIIVVLIKSKGNVLSREQIIDSIFGLDFEGYDRTIDVHIKNIRKKIEVDSRNPKYIVTVTKVGYKFGGEINC